MTSASTKVRPSSRTALPGGQGKAGAPQLAPGSSAGDAKRGAGGEPGVGLGAPGGTARGVCPGPR